MKMQKYKLRFFVDWGGGPLWSDASDTFTFERFNGSLVDLEELNVSKGLCEELDSLQEEWQGALNWEYPPDPSPWSEEQFKDFYARLKVAYQRLCEELKDTCDIAYWMDDRVW